MYCKILGNLCCVSVYLFRVFLLHVSFGPGMGYISKQDGIPVLMQLKPQGEQRKTDSTYLINTTVKKKGREIGTKSSGLWG